MIASTPVPAPCELAAFGLVSDAAAPAGPLRVEPAGNEQLGADAAFALTTLAASLGAIYAVEGVEAWHQVPGLGVTFLVIGVLQAGWLRCWRVSGSSPPRSTIALNLVLAAAWALSRTVGLPTIASGRQPVGVLDAACAADAVLIALLAFTLRRPSQQRPADRRASLSHVAILLAVCSLAMLAGGHVHGNDIHLRWSGSAAHTYYCHLL